MADTFVLSRATLASLFDFVDEAVLCIHGDGTIEFASRGWQTIFGFDPVQAVGRNVADLVHPDDITHVVESLARWEGRSGAPQGDEVRVATADGGWRQVRYDAVVGLDTPELGAMAITLTPTEVVDADYRELQSRVLSEQALISLATRFLTISHDAFDEAVAAALELFGQLEWVTRSALWTARRDGFELRASWTAPGNEPIEELPQRLLHDHHASLRRLAEGHDVSMSAPKAGAGTDAATDYQARTGVVSALAFPLVSSGGVLGFIAVESTLRDITADAKHRVTLQAGAAIITQAMVRHEAERQLVLQARFDRTTQLPNRWSLDEALAAGLERLAAHATGGIAVALLDLDRFKLVNDVHGHAAGDQLLADLTRRLVRELDDDIELFRLGGDELVAVVDAARIEDAHQRLVPLLALTRAPLDLQGQPIVLTASVGLAFTDDPSVAGGDLLRRADRAMYHAKRLGGDAIAIDDPFDDGADARSLRMEGDLRRALAEASPEIAVHYQGEWDLERGVLVGVEALARWQHPADGLLAAGEFIPVAEASGLIDELGSVVLDTACRDIAGWSALLDAGFVLRVNVSARQLRQAGFVDQVAEALDRSGLPAGRLCLELTESAIISDRSLAAKVLDGLRSFDVGLAIDDFGTGYSSVLQLKELPLTALKVDRAFVTDLPDDPVDSAIVGTTVQLAASMGLTVTAEGIETEPQREALVALGCRRGQGYLLSRPEPADDFVQRLEAGRPRR